MPFWRKILNKYLTFYRMKKIFRQFVIIGVAIMIVHISFAQKNNYIVGADLSFLKQAEGRGKQYKENGEAKPGLQLFKEHGYNWIRLRIFHTPTELPNNLEYTIAMATEAKKSGYKFLLDYHYSDTWADPGKQFIPKAWEGKSHEELVKAVYEYTRETMIAFREAGVYPDMVQVGNEISNGMLWPDGKLPANWDNFIALLQAGINGVYASCGYNSIPPSIMIHIDKGGNKSFTKYFFDKIESYGVKYDIIGQSYYPWWHGSLLDLKECLNFAAETYKKDVILVEAAYNHQPQEYKDKPAPFPETPEGQKDFLEAVQEIVLNIPDNKGVGLFYWEPTAMRSYFDKEGNALPVMNVFDKYTRK
jgi:arabinogalactan endo-1,4-beta-galactosidase